MIKQETKELLNAKHADIESDLRLYGALTAMLKKDTPFKNVLNLKEEIENYLIDTLDIDLDEVEEEEETLEDGVLSAFQQADQELKVLLSMDRNLAQLKNVGMAEEELQGYKDFQKRLTSVIFERYGIEESSKEGESNE